MRNGYKNRGGQQQPTREEAEQVAIRVLAWLSADPSLMSRFLALSGLDAGSIRAAAAEPGFHAGLTGFVMAHEPTLNEFAAAEGLTPAYVASCHHCLEGPEASAWL